MRQFTHTSFYPAFPDSFVRLSLIPPTLLPLVSGAGCCIGRAREVLPKSFYLSERAVWAENNFWVEPRAFRSISS